MLVDKRHHFHRYKDLQNKIIPETIISFALLNTSIPKNNMHLQLKSFGTHIECAGQTPPNAGSGSPNPQSVWSSVHRIGSLQGLHTLLHCSSQYSVTSDSAPQETK